MPEAPSLIFTLHDEEGWSKARWETFLPLCQSLFSSLAAILSPATSAEVRRVLLRGGVELAPPAGLEETRQEALRLIIAKGYQATLLCDGDRLLHWLATYPKELEGVLPSVMEHDYLILGRTARAFATHPRVQRETEALVNQVVSLLLRRQVDVTAGARGLSLGAARFLAARSAARWAESDGQWPVLLHRAGRFRIGYLEVEGLEFETGDRHQAAIAEAGGPEAWKESLSRSPQEWLRRLDYAYQAVKGAVQASTMPLEPNEPSPSPTNRQG